MAHEVIMPALGMAQDTGLLVSWQKSVGDAVKSDDVLMEVETDKSTMEVPAGADGFLAEVRAEAGQDVPVGRVIAIISREAPDPASAPQSRAATVAASTQEPMPEDRSVPEAASEAVIPRPLASIPAAEGRVLASPKARRLAEEAGLDLSQLAEAGIEQPYHVSDIETLTNLPIQGQLPDMAYAPVSSHIGASVPARSLDQLVAQMRDEGGVELGLEQITLSFAASALRAATAAEHLTISLRTADGEREVFDNPDQGQLSKISSAPRDGRSQLELRVIKSGYLTTLTLGGGPQPMLFVARSADNINLTLAFSELQLDPNQAIEMMNGLTQRLAEPLLALV